MSVTARSSAEHRRVVLVNPNRMKPPVAPIALDYLAHALRGSGFEVDVLDLCFSDDVARDIEVFFSTKDVLAVAVTLRNADDTFFVTQDFCIDRYKEIVDLIKEQTTAPVILGGSGFSIMPREILSYYDLELGIWGDGEESLPLLLYRIAEGEDCADVPGLVRRNRDEFLTVPPTYTDLTRMSAPDRSAVDNRRYFAEGAMGSVETKRGCPNSCIYCVDPVGKGSGIRLRSPRSVADEAQTLLGMDIDHLHLCDSEFNIPERHARDVCLELAGRGLGDRLRWYTYATPAGFSRELAALLRRAGCAGVNFGADSGCDSMLRSLGRDFTVDELAGTAEACRSEGIACMFDLLIGGPGETRETLRESIEAMKRMSPDRVGANLGVRVFPGTGLAQIVREQGPLDGNPNLHGSLSGNEGFFKPVYYISSELGPDAIGYLANLIGDDERFFFFGDTAGAGQNYNYNDNTVLVDAIRKGYRGAFWDILRRLGESG